MVGGEPVELWHLGNTTVRSPFRLRDGLQALAASSLVGDLQGREQESTFAWLLNDSGVLNLSRRRDEDVSDTGRKWRVALEQLGFLFPSEKKQEQLNGVVIGAPFTISTSGRRLLGADSVPAMQECFLRAITAYELPSIHEPSYSAAPFSPLVHVLSVLRELEMMTGDSRLNFVEFAVHVQTTTGDDRVDEICDRILAMRNERAAATNTKAFDSAAYSRASTELSQFSKSGKAKKPGTFVDYADLSLRYLRATGLVVRRGRGIGLAKEKRTLVERLVDEFTVSTSPEEYLERLCDGARLPTDSAEGAADVLDSLQDIARGRGLDASVGVPASDSPADIAQARYRLEALIALDREAQFAQAQPEAVEEISSYLALLANKKLSTTQDDELAIKIPPSERPAYFEWAVWRAFLAMNHLVNAPHDARRFKVDQDLLPVGTAPGGGPDLLFEFEDYVLVVEVTLTDNSRQEAAEGEPVRRHVADEAVRRLAAGSHKPVYGLFIANRIDSNTAETFRVGSWYLPDDSRLALSIVPTPLEGFTEFFSTVAQAGVNGPKALRVALDNALDSDERSIDAPSWKRRTAGLAALAEVS